MSSARTFGGCALTGAPGPAKGTKITRAALLLALATFVNIRANSLFSFGPDNVNDPRSFTLIDTSGSTATALYNMNDVNDGFNGGLAYRPSNGLFYAIMNDSLGNSSLISFAENGGGTFTTLQAVGAGFAGLAFDTSDNTFYGLNLDSTGFSTLNQITVGGSTNAMFGLGLGFNGGLTFDSLDGNLYAIANDSSGNSTLYRIGLNGSVTALTGTLGSGFLGGLAYDLASNSFYAIDNDSLGNSTLYRIVVTGSSLTGVAPLFGIGAGFVNADLVDVAPEPATPWLFGCCAVLMLICRSGYSIRRASLRRNKR